MTGYTLSDGVTLKNKFGEFDRDKLGGIEAAYTKLRAIEIAAGYGPSGAFNLERLKATHRHLFQDVYEWAGRTRDEQVRLSDGEIATEPVIRKPGSQPFTHGPKLGRDLNRLFGQLSDEGNLTGLTREEFATRAASYFAAVNTAHPFREGNGRTQRTFFEALAKSAGHTLHFEVVSGERMTVASIEAHERGDVSGFVRLFREISDPQRVAALRQAQQFLDSQRFPWRDHYMATTEPGRTYDLTMVGRGGAHFMAHARDSGIIVGHSRDLPEPAPSSGTRFTMTAAPEAQRQIPAEPQQDVLSGKERARPKMPPKKG